jgi:hypothetical protein
MDSFTLVGTNRDLHKAIHYIRNHPYDIQDFVLSLEDDLKESICSMSTDTSIPLMDRILMAITKTIVERTESSFIPYDQWKEDFPSLVDYSYPRQRVNHQQLLKKLVQPLIGHNDDYFLTSYGRTKFTRQELKLIRSIGLDLTPYIDANYLPI